MTKPLATLLSEAALVRIIGNLLLMPVGWADDWHEAASSRWIWRQEGKKHVLPVLGIIRGILAPLGLAPQVLLDAYGDVAGIALHRCQAGAQNIRSQPPLTDDSVDVAAKALVADELPADMSDTLPPDGPVSGVRPRQGVINDVDDFVTAFGGEDDDPDAVYQRILKADRAALKAFAGSLATWASDNDVASREEAVDAIETMLSGGIVSSPEIGRARLDVATAIPAHQFRRLKDLAQAAGGMWREAANDTQFVKLSKNRFEE